MFKRLKKKLEEGETSTVQPIIPGQPVRLLSEDFNSSSEQGNSPFEALVPLKDQTRVSSDANEKYDQTGDNSTSSSDRILSRGISTSSWLGGGLSAMIRGDSQIVAELTKDKEKLEAALEKQQDLMAQRLREQGDMHQKELSKAVEVALTSKQHELDGTLTIISSLKERISVLESELTHSDSARSILEEQYSDLKKEHSKVLALLDQKEYELAQFKLSAGTAASAEEKIHSNVDLPTSDTDLPSTEVEDRSSSIVSKDDLEELKSKAEGLEIGIDTRTTAPKEVLRSKVLFSESAVLQVKERDIQWTEESPARESVQALTDNPVHESTHENLAGDFMKQFHMLSEENKRIREDLMDKNQVIKIQQQKMIDLKKTLQKELRTQPSVDTSPSVLPTPSRSVSVPNHIPQDKPVSANDVSFQYLKHVVFRYMCSEGEEAKYLVKAISTLLKFTPQEERHVKDYMDYKISWFGTKPYVQLTKQHF